MKYGPDIAPLASLIGDPARANMLGALMSGKALTAGELATEAGVTPQTASSHLARLMDARLLLVEVQGRHRYFRLAGPEVAAAIEALMGLAARTGRLRTRQGPKDAALRQARLCYDHLAGEMGVALYDAMFEQGFLANSRDRIEITPAGRSRFLAEGIDMPALEARKRPLCRACLDWSERRPHLAGSLGAALVALFIAREWGKREDTGRVFRFSPAGIAAFRAFTSVGPIARSERDTAASGQSR